MRWRVHPFGAALVPVSPPAEVAADFRDSAQVAEPLEGRGARVVRGHPLLEELADAHLEMKGELPRLDARTGIGSIRAELMTRR
jgi:hypothetical protein